MKLSDFIYGYWLFEKLKKKPRAVVAAKLIHRPDLQKLLLEADDHAQNVLIYFTHR